MKELYRIINKPATLHEVAVSAVILSILVLLSVVMLIVILMIPYIMYIVLFVLVSAIAYSFWKVFGYKVNSEDNHDQH